MIELTILVVEDNPLNIELATDLLEVAGYRVLQARTAEQGLFLAQAELPHLILMDISLPGMDGLTATATLKGDPATASIPIVALTAHALRGDDKQLLSAGCDGYLAKPIDTKQFARCVADFIGGNGST